MVCEILVLFLNRFDQTRRAYQRRRSMLLVAKSHFLIIKIKSTAVSTGVENRRRWCTNTRVTYSV